MPAKKNHNSMTGVDEETPVKSSPVDDRHVKLREDRLAIEAELAVIDEQIRTAINNGDLDSLDKLSARKGELPRLFIAASSAEMAARQASFSAEDAENLKRLRAAEDKRDELHLALVRLHAKHEEEIAALTAELHETITEVGAAYSSIQSSRDLSATCNDGFKRSMAALTGV